MITATEFTANAVTTLSIFLAGRNNINTWWTGIIGGIVFCIVYYESQLYADVTLQIFFMATSLLGWYQWRKGNYGQVLKISSAGRSLFGLAILVGCLTTMGYGALLKHFTNAYAPYVDSGILAFSIIAQVFLMQRRMETWPFWLLVNTIAVPLYASRGLYLTSFLYSAYWINALVSWQRWKRLGRV